MPSGAAERGQSLNLPTGTPAGVESLGSVAVIGAGVCGLVAAVRAAQAGAAVTLHDASDRLGAAAASWLAGGMLAPFCEAESAPAAIVAPGLAGIAWWAQQAVGLERRGTLVLAPARDRAELARFARRTRGHERLDAAGLAALEPDLAGRFEEALFFADEAHLDPRRAIPALVERLEALGGRLVLGSAPDPREVAADRVLDCRGLAGGPAFPGLRCVRGEMAMLRAPDVSLSRPARLLHPRHPVYVVPRGDGRFMVGATMIEAEDGRAVTLRSAVELMNAAYALHPAFAEAEVLELSAGRRPALPDNLPAALHEGRVTRLNGLYRHGFLLSPWLAGEALEKALSGSTTKGRHA